MTRDQEIKLAAIDVANAERGLAAAWQSGNYQRIESCEGLLHDRRARLRELEQSARWERKTQGLVLAPSA